MIGYPCSNVTLLEKDGTTPARTCRLSTLLKSPDPMEHCIELARNNIESTIKIIQWNIEHDISMYRMSASMFPFSTHPEFFWHLDSLDADIKPLAELLKQSGHRVSTHLPQFLNLGSPNEYVVDKSVNDLNFHADFFDKLELDTSHKIIIHGGGVYENREETQKRFAKNYLNLNENVKKRLVIENDEKSWSIKQLMEIQKITDMTVLIDYFHWQLNHERGRSFKKDLELSLSTWKEKPKIHYSEQDSDKRPGAHSYYIKDIITSNDFDTMVEAKGKEKAILPFIKSQRILSII